MLKTNAHPLESFRALSH